MVMQGLDCCQELLEMLAEWLPQHYPDRFLQSQGQLRNIVSGETFDLAKTDVHPLKAASLLVQVCDLTMTKGPACQSPTSEMTLS